MTAIQQRLTATVRSVGAALSGAVTRARLVLALKTAVAVAIAWTIAHYMPGVTDDYPYYAPLGVLISMHPMLMDSMRSAIQTLAGLLCGMALALIVVSTIGPSIWTLALVAGVGVLLAGIGWFGSGGDYVAVAAVFVLIIGGQDADAYSLGYLVQMGVGLAVGLAVNFLFAPGTLSASAQARVAEYQQEMAGHLTEIGETIEGAWPPERAEWTRDAHALHLTAGEVHDALSAADRSRRANPRAFRGRHGTGGAYARLAILDSIVVRVRDISDALEDVVHEHPGYFPLDEELVPYIADACRKTGGAIAAIGDEDAAAHRARAAAAASVRHLLNALDTGRDSARSILGPGVLVALHLRRIVTLLHARGRQD